MCCLKPVFRLCFTFWNVVIFSGYSRNTVFELIMFLSLVYFTFNQCIVCFRFTTQVVMSSPQWWFVCFVNVINIHTHIMHTAVRVYLVKVDGLSHRDPPGYLRRTPIQTYTRKGLAIPHSILDSPGIFKGFDGLRLSSVSWFIHLARSASSSRIAKGLGISSFSSGWQFHYTWLFLRIFKQGRFSPPTENLPGAHVVQRSTLWNQIKH